jgi:hypothetical protein
MNDEFRAITKNQRSFDSAVMMSSLMPSEKYSCSGSSLMLVKGSTAIAGRSGSGKAGRDGSWISSAGGSRPVPVRAVEPASHVADKAKALARDGADQFCFVAAVANRLARGVDAAGQSRIRHDPAAPDRSEEIVLADDAVAVLHQVDQQVEHLGLDGNGLGTAAQLAPVGIKPVIGKEKFHVAALAAGMATGLKE